MEEDELLDEEDIVDGASEGSDDAARMGIQSMQVSIESRCCENAFGCSGRMLCQRVCCLFRVSDPGEIEQTINFGAAGA